MHRKWRPVTAECNLSFPTRAKLRLLRRRGDAPAALPSRQVRLLGTRSKAGQFLGISSASVDSCLTHLFPSELLRLASVEIGPIKCIAKHPPETPRKLALLTSKASCPTLAASRVTRCPFAPPAEPHTCHSFVPNPSNPSWRRLLQIDRLCWRWNTDKWRFFRRLRFHCRKRPVACFGNKGDLFVSPARASRLRRLAVPCSHKTAWQRSKCHAPGRIGRIGRTPG